jgi:outer membrane protein assembly factor BamA
MTSQTSIARAPYSPSVRLTRSLFALAIASLLACAGAQSNSIASATACPDPARTSLRGIDLSLIGNTAVDTSVLRCDLLRRFEGGTPPVFERDADRTGFLDAVQTFLLAAYTDHGYLSADVARPVLDGPGARGRFTVTAQIRREGPRFRVGRTSVVEHDDEGHEIEPLGRSSIRSLLTLHPGDWFSRALAVESLRAVARRYHDAGYAHAVIDPVIELHPETGTADFHIYCRRGALVNGAHVESRD